MRASALAVARSAVCGVKVNGDLGPDEQPVYVTFTQQLRPALIVLAYK
jgi:hypothetical protein